MDRRRFVGAVTATLLTGPLASLAQPAGRMFLHERVP